MWRWNVLTQGSLTVCCLEKKQQPDILYSYTVCVLYILQKTLKFCNIKRLWVVVCLFSFTLFCFALVYFAVTFLAPSPISSANKTDIDLLHFPTIFFQSGTLDLSSHIVLHAVHTQVLCPALSGFFVPMFSSGHLVSSFITALLGYCLSNVMAKSLKWCFHLTLNLLCILFMHILIWNLVSSLAGAEMRLQQRGKNALHVCLWEQLTWL